jgi:hypothetical protein
MDHMGAGAQRWCEEDSTMNLDSRGRRIVGKRWQAYRNRICEHRLRLWRRLEATLDATRAPVDGALVGAGAAECATVVQTVVQPDRMVRQRYFRQPDDRALRARYLPQLKRVIARAYRIAPVTADDMVMLEAYLRTYVADEKVRRELFAEAQAAASNVPGA